MNGPRYELFSGVDDERWFWLNTVGCREDEAVRAILPGMPGEELQRATIGSCGDTALREGFEAYRLFVELFRRHVGRLTPQTRVLDFGCGWGRVLRFFLREVDQAGLWGVDPIWPFVEAARRANPWCQYVEGGKAPPSPFAPGYFDLVYAYSVFSHLSEAAHRAWLADIHRVLRPGGLLIATTWQREHIERSEALRLGTATSESDWHRLLAGMWQDTGRWLAGYDEGQFCYQPYPVDTHRWSYDHGDSYYGEACIPEAYARDRWSPGFELLEFITDRDRCPQNVIVARRRLE